ncbi:hypothetical protein PHET_04995 [Paragonimus heterotremus]|uniref:Uncharacterized protein n=1 Tax=Paragonimus heterotremus TaxID=100268 RepID=A0A8J4SQ43_9TREM|nr:hypothetical protein PHET_04995 [Paragonimus heterotremus]
MEGNEYSIASHKSSILSGCRATYPDGKTIASVYKVSLLTRCDGCVGPTETSILTQIATEAHVNQHTLAQRKPRSVDSDAYNENNKQHPRTASVVELTSHVYADSTSDKVKEHYSIPYESVEFFLKPFRQERKARMKQLLSQPIYESFPTPFEKVRHLADDPHVSDCPRRKYVGEYWDAVVRRHVPVTDGVDKQGEVCDTVIKIVSNVMSAQSMNTSPTGRQPGEYTSSHNMSTVCVPSTGDRESPPLLTNLTEQDSVFTHLPSNQFSFIVSSSTANDSSCQSNENLNIKYQSDPQVLATENTTLSPKNPQSSVELNILTNDAFDAADKRKNSKLNKKVCAFEGWIDEPFIEDGDSQVNLSSIRPSIALQSHEANRTLFPSVLVQSEHSQSYSIVNSLTDPTEICDYLLDRGYGFQRTCPRNWGSSSKCIRLLSSPSDYEPMGDELTVRSSCYKECAVQHMVNMQMSGSQPPLILSYPAKPVSPNCISRVEEHPRTRVCVQQKPGYGLEFIGSPKQLLVYCSGLLYPCNWNYHPMGASSSYSEVPKQNLQMALTIPKNFTWNSSERIAYQRLPDLQYLYGYPVERIRFIPQRNGSDHFEPEYASTFFTGQITCRPQNTFIVEQNHSDGNKSECFNTSCLQIDCEQDFHLDCYSVEHPVTVKLLSICVSISNTVIYWSSVDFGGQYFLNETIISLCPATFDKLNRTTLNSAPVQRTIQTLNKYIPYFDIRSDQVESYAGVTTEPTVRLDALFKRTNPEFIQNAKNVLCVHLYGFSITVSQLVCFSVGLQVTDLQEHTGFLDSVGHLHVRPARASDFHTSRVVQVSSYFVRELVDPNVMIYPPHWSSQKKTSGPMVRIQNPPIARLHTQPVSPLETPASQTTMFSEFMGDVNSGRTSQAHVTTEHVDRRMFWDWEQNEKPNITIVNRKSMHETYGMRRETSHFTDQIKPAFSVGETPMISINVNSQSGVNYEIKFGGSQDLHLGIHTVSTTAIPELVRERDGKLKKMCLPLPKFFRKKTPSFAR